MTDAMSDGSEPGPEVRERNAARSAFAVRAAKAAWVSYSLLGVNVAVFIAMIVSGANAWHPSVEDIVAFGANHGPLVVAGEWWRLYTCTFVHAGILHIAFNMWALRVLGPPVEKIFGNAAFFLVYTLAGLGGSIASCLWNPNGLSVGASGAIFGLPGAIVAFFLTHRSEMPAGLFRAQMQRMATFIGLNVLLGLSIPQVDNAAHLGGLVTGFLCGLAAYRDALATPILTRGRLVRLLLVGALLVASLAIVRWRVRGDRAAGTSYWLNRARDAYEEHDLDAAREYGDRAIALDPTNAVAFSVRGAIEYSGNRPDQAMPFLDRAIELDPSRVGPYEQRGWLRMMRGDAGALADFDRAIALDPARPWMFESRGQVLESLGEWQRALRDFQTAIGLDPIREDDLHLYVWLCRASLGVEESATVELRHWLDGARLGDSWQRDTGEFLAKALPEGDYLARMTSKRDAASDARAGGALMARCWYFTGERRRLDRDVEGAKGGFRFAVEGAINRGARVVEVDHARARLAQLETGNGVGR